MNSSGGWIADPRARRAIAVIAIAVVAIVAAGVIYLHPSFGSSSPTHKALEVRPSPTPPQIDGRFSATYDFITPSLGWALVSQNVSSRPSFWVFRTSDGAKHWVQQMTGQCEGLGTSNLNMFDRLHGELDLCDPLVAYRSSDGGASWSAIALPHYSFASVNFSDALHGWYLAWSAEMPSPPTPGQLDQPALAEFLATADGGSTWTKLPTPPHPSFSGKGGFFNMQFRGAKTGWMGTDIDPATIYSTADGGFSWRPLTLPVSAPTDGNGEIFNTRVQVLPRSGLIAVVVDVSDNATGLTSFDGGLTWHQIASPPGNTTFDDYAFIDDSHWWAMRNSTLYKSSDAGQSWKLATLLLDQWVYSPHPLDSKHAWAAISGGGTIDIPAGSAPDSGFLAPGGGLATTSDGGLLWTYVNVPQPRLS